MKYKLLLLTIIAFTSRRTFAQTEVTFYTNKGNFVVSLEETKRPVTTANFIKLVKAKFYDKQLFYRVVKNFVIQGGDGGNSNTPAIKDELTPAFSNVINTIAMANAGPNTASSEIYINLKNNTGLDKNYTAFGTVISNTNVVQTIGLVATNSNDKPLVNVVMDSVRITSVPTVMNEVTDKCLAIDVFPNPTDGIIHIVCEQTIKDVFITDVTGRKAALPSNQTNNCLDVAFLPSGIYCLQVQTSIGVEVKKIIKK